MAKKAKRAWSTNCSKKEPKAKAKAKELAKAKERERKELEDPKGTREKAKANLEANPFLLLGPKLQKKQEIKEKNWSKKI